MDHNYKGISGYAGSPYNYKHKTTRVERFSTLYLLSQMESRWKLGGSFIDLFRLPEGNTFQEIVCDSLAGVLLQLPNILFSIETKAFLLRSKNGIPNRTVFVGGMRIVVKTIFLATFCIGHNLHLVPRLQYHVKSTVARRAVYAGMKHVRAKRNI
jgi:hypothetical protein